VGFLIGAICVGQILAQVGAFSVPALLPSLMSEWSLSNTEAGWVTGIFYAGYAVSVPVLVSLTDKANLSSRCRHNHDFFCWVCLLCRRFLLRMCVSRPVCGGGAATYMPGLKALSDIVGGP